MYTTYVRDRVQPDASVVESRSVWLAMAHQLHVLARDVAATDRPCDRHLVTLAHQTLELIHRRTTVVSAALLALDVVGSQRASAMSGHVVVRRRARLERLFTQRARGNAEWPGYAAFLYACCRALRLAMRQHFARVRMRRQARQWLNADECLASMESVLCAEFPALPVRHARDGPMAA